MNADVNIRSESLWVLCNLISSSSTDELAIVIKQYERTIGEVDIIYPLCYNLTKIEKGELKLLLEMIKSIESLLKLSE